VLLLFIAFIVWNQLFSFFIYFFPFLQ